MKGLILGVLLAMGIFVMFANAEQKAKPVTIKVGSSERIPYLNKQGEGLGPDIIAALNKLQSTFKFELIAMPIKRSQLMIDEGWVDISMWEIPEKGWKNAKNFNVSKPLIFSKDLFITKKSDDKNQGYFSSFQDKRIAAVHGYHYNFANNETDRNKLLTQFDINLLQNDRDTITMVIKDRAEIAVTSEVSLNWYLHSQPQYKDTFLLSDKADSSFSRHFIVPTSSPISVDELNRILMLAADKGVLTPIYRKYGLNAPKFK